MGWYTSKEGWKNAEAKRIDFDDRIWEDATYYANWKNTTPFDLTGDGLDEPVKFTEGDDVESLYMSAKGWHSLPDGVTGLVFKDASGNEIDPSSPPLDNVHVTVVYDVRIENGILQYVNPVLTEYTIPASVTEIASGAFDGCTELETVYIASRSSALAVQEGAFDECEKLSLVAGYADSTAMGSVIKASGVTRAHITAGTIASYAFDGCTSLTSVTIPDSVTSIGSYAFSGCDSLTSITIPDGVTSIGGYAFYSCDSLTSVAIGNGVTSIGDDTFSRCTSLTSVTIPDGVTSIGEQAFNDCTGLTSVTIGDGVTRIGSNAFSRCTSLEAVYITDIGKWVAIYFDSLYGVSVANPLSYAGNLYLNGELVTDLVIPDDVTSIGKYAFCGCDSLTSITIPDSVTSIGSSAFSGCTGLTSVTSGNGVTSIGDRAFYSCYSLTSVTIPDSVTSIGEDAFYGCSGLTSITIPDSVTSIGYGAFWGCNSLKYNQYGNALYLGNDENPYLILIKAKDMSITSVNINTSTKWIHSRAFAYCDSLTSVTIGNGVTSIGSSAFTGCSNLTAITIPNSVTSIGERAFSDCTALTSITIPDSVTSIGERAFECCTSLTSVTFEGTKAEWNAVGKSWLWNYDCPFSVVECSDGNVSV